MSPGKPPPVIALVTLALLLAACSQTGDTGGKEVVTFWSTETQPDRVVKTERIAGQFTDETGIEVEVVPIEEDELASLVTSRAASGDLPDVVFHYLDLTPRWAEQGLLDLDAATEVVDSLGRDTFSSRALELAIIEGKVAAVPVDSWGNVILYRKDLFAEAGLEPPTTYEAILKAARELNDAQQNMYGITAPNDASTTFTQQVFETFALANGCQLTDAEGNVTLDSPQCLEAIEFYTGLNDYGPPGTQNVDSTLATYLAGQAAMITWSTFILDDVAGLVDDAPPNCPQCKGDLEYLGKNSGVVTTLQGPQGSPIQWGQIGYFGITVDADIDATKKFVEFMLSDGYRTWLSLAPEGKYPARSGTAQDAERYVQVWRTLEVGVDRRASLLKLYGAEVVNSLAQGADRYARWGFEQGTGSLAGSLYETLLVPELLQAVLNGKVSPEEAAQRMQEEAQRQLE